MAPCFLPATISTILQLINGIQQSLPSSSESNEESSALLQDLQNLCKTFKRIQAVLEDADKRDIQDETVKQWLSEIRDVAYQAEDVLDDFQYEVLRIQVDDAKDLEQKQKDDAVKLLSDESQYKVLCTQFDAEAMVKKQKVSVQVTDHSRLMSFVLESGIKGRIDAIKHTLEEISKARADFWLGDEHGKRIDDSIVTCSPTPSTHKVKSNICGRETEKKEVIQLLLSENDSKLLVVAIIGTGGIGKTTLAQLVYNDHMVSEHFDKRMWVYVSQEFDVVRIGKTIVQDLTERSCNVNEPSLLTKTLDHELKGKKLLLVLDDVWNENLSLWEALEDLLSGAYMVKILLTARDKTVTKVMKTVILYPLRDLPEAECWQLFENYAFNGKDSSDLLHLVAIGKEIVKKCHGLPLAAKSLGCLLRDKEDEDSWNDVLQSELWDLPRQDEILPALKLSYNRMPSYLKSCFAYCSMFPKGYLLYRDELVHLWIAQGFIESKSGKNLEDIARRYVDELSDRSFLEIVHFADDITMHDKIHELAMYVSNGECGALVGGKIHCFGKFDYHLTHLYSDSCLEGCVENPSGIRTFDNRQFVDDNICSVTSMKGLRALRLAHMHSDGSNSYLGNLKHLKYLHISFVKQLPDSICHLLNLQTLHLECLRIDVLPKEFGNLVSLKFLSLRDCIALKQLPDSICHLLNLQTLHLVCLRIDVLPKEFGNLANLRFLNLSNCEELKQLADSICNLLNLQTLHLDSLPIEVLPMKFGSLVSIKFLSLRYCSKLKELPESVGDLINLYHLDVTGTAIRWFPTSFWGLRNIEFIYSIGICIQITGAELKNFVKLKVPLRISGIGNIIEVDDAKKVELKNKHRIEYLHLYWNDRSFWLFRMARDSYLSVCFSRQTDVVCDVIKNAEVILENLRPHVRIKELSIMAYPGVQYPEWVRDLSSFTKLTKIELNACCPSYLRSLGQLPVLRCLDIESCDVRSIGEEFYCFNSNVTRRATFPMLKEMNLVRCGDLWKWDGMLDGDFPVLEKLDIGNCGNLLELPSIDMSDNFPGRYPSSWAFNDSFTMLTQIRLFDTGITCVPTLGQLPALESLYIGICKNIKTIGPQFCWSGSKVKRMVAFPALTILELNQLDELEIWYGINDGDFPQLIDLTIIRCSKLRMLPTFGQLPVLKSLYIENCGKIKRIGPWFCWSGSKVERRVAFPALTNLELYKLRKLEMWYGVCEGDFPQLRVLKIDYCPQLRSCPSSLFGNPRRR